MQLNTISIHIFKQLSFKKVSRVTLGCQYKFMASRPKPVRMSSAFRQNTTKNVLMIFYFVLSLSKAAN